MHGLAALPAVVGHPYNPPDCSPRHCRMSERRRILFSGRVQGVGFRMTAVHLAQGLPLSGTVQNLPDGDVELVVEGAAADIDTLIDRLREHFAGLIRTVSQDRSPRGAPLKSLASGPPGIRIIH